MADVAALHAAVLAHLQDALPYVRVYDGDVPDTPPRDDAGRVYGYAVVWATGPRRHADRPLQRGPDDSLDWGCHVTVAAGTQTWCLQAGQAVRAALDGWAPPGAGRLREPDGAPGDLVVRIDRDIRPPRFYLPFEFRTPTTS